MSIGAEKENNSPSYTGAPLYLLISLKDDDGTDIPIGDISSATWRCKKPDDSIVSGAAVIGASYIEITISDSDIDLEGLYKVQANVTFLDAKFSITEEIHREVFTAI